MAVVLAVVVSLATDVAAEAGAVVVGDVVTASSLPSLGSDQCHHADHHDMSSHPPMVTRNSCDGRRPCRTVGVGDHIRPPAAVSKAADASLLPPAA